MPLSSADPQIIRDDKIAKAAPSQGSTQPVEARVLLLGNMWFLGDDVPRVGLWPSLGATIVS